MRQHQLQMTLWGGCGTSAGWKLDKKAQIQTIWWLRRAIDSSIVDVIIW